jgi:hypothetical protein
MELYNPKNIEAGQSWLRVKKIDMFNELGETPIVSFIEERVYSVGGDISKKNTDNLSVVFNPDEVIDIIDPTTNIDTGQRATMGQLYAIMYSMYLKLATARDNAE